ncbi:hypothetical protein LMH87_003300 [Akanthomyces muscarius]|uniref:Cholesterol oxidase n=1 Tax=Akanthomyces muscarius TaxID=2231603 RepID=A0A9W8Q315_AKAMU|nr:hypothetical protein LMH87_003300 [Akanthomyces muscarius]KAJ4144416.1 hypothetical protein LMH87_003300 [Akanthomyces muscarius]
MSPSTLTGQDTTGINDGSKTTTLVTYLTDAWKWGADIFCECEVRYVEKASDELGGYIVYFVSHDSPRARFQDDIYSELSWVHAENAVFLGAGSIGTTEILLRSKAMGLSMSDYVGQGMSGNGDMLAFGHNPGHGAKSFRNPETPNPTSTNRVGPTITSVIDMRDKTDNSLDGYVIQDGAVPQVLSTFVKTVLRTHTVFSSSRAPIRQRMANLLSRCKQRLLHPFSNANIARDAQVFLIMSHDSSQAEARLEDDKLMFEFLGSGRNEKHVERILAPLRKVVEEDGGTLVYNPLRRLWGNHQVTVHPLGGARMSRDNSGKNGVTNHLGEVFVGPGSETHPGLIVVDGAAIPAALGVNPCATIAALAERSVADFAKRQSLAICTKSNGTIDLHRPGSAHQPNTDPIKPCTQAAKRPPSTLCFTELLEGGLYSSQTISLGNSASYERAYSMARARGEVARLLASIRLQQNTQTHAKTRYSGTISGTLVCPSIQGSPFMVHNGTVELFQPDPEISGTRKLVYDCPMTGINGRELHLHGLKVLNSAVSFRPRQLWRTMTTLNVTIVKKRGNVSNDDSEDQTIAAGMLKIKLGKFMKQLSTIMATGEHLREKSKQVLGLSRHFTRQMASQFFLPLVPMQYAAAKPLGGFTNPTDPTATYKIVAEDGIVTKLLMWEPDPRHVPRDIFGILVPIENLFMIPGASVDHQIFALPTIATNAVNYFTRAGYRVFVIVHRVGRLDTIDRDSNWTTYDARLDIRAGFEKVREIWGADKIYTVAHCMGSVAFSCGLLDGTIPADWVLGITCSQVFMNPVWSTTNMAKAKCAIPLDKLYGAVAGPWFSCQASPGGSDGFRQGLLNQMFRLLPEDEGERCSSASCHRTTLLFGRCWSHANLNEETHRHIDKFFGGSSLTLVHLLMRMGRRGHVSTNGPAFAELTTDENVERLRGIPMFLFSGGDSDVLSPQATEMTYERLCRKFGLSAGGARPGLQYRRRVIPGYGHLDCWMGRDACRDVYPIVLDEINRVVGRVQQS